MNYIQENFHKWTPEIVHYSIGDRKALRYMTEEEGYPEIACMATINLPEEPIEDNEIIVKSYSENKGLYEMMLAAGHIGPELRRVYSGFVSAPVCKLLIK